MLQAEMHLRDGFNHVNSHLHTAVSMISTGLRQSRDTIVTIPQDLYAQAMVLLETGKDSYNITAELLFSAIYMGQKQHAVIYGSTINMCLAI